MWDIEEGFWLYGRGVVTTLALGPLSGANLSLLSTSISTQQRFTYLLEGEACRALGVAGNL